MKANRAGIEVGRYENRALGGGAQALSAPPILVTIVSCLGAVCIGAWACLNLLHWFWRQLRSAGPKLPRFTNHLNLNIFRQPMVGTCFTGP